MKNPPEIPEEAKSRSRRQEALQYLKIPKKSESRDLVSYKIWSFLTDC